MHDLNLLNPIDLVSIFFFFPFEKLNMSVIDMGFESKGYMSIYFPEKTLAADDWLLTTFYDLFFSIFCVRFIFLLLDPFYSFLVYCLKDEYIEFQNWIFIFTSLQFGSIRLEVLKLLLINLSGLWFIGVTPQVYLDIGRYGLTAF